MLVPTSWGADTVESNLTVKGSAATQSNGAQSAIRRVVCIPYSMSDFRSARGHCAGSLRGSIGETRDPENEYEREAEQGQVYRQCAVQGMQIADEVGTRAE